MKTDKVELARPLWAVPVTGTILTVLAALMFYFLCMLLPLVGPAGAVVPHARQNFWAFLSALLVALLLSALALAARLAQARCEAAAASDTPRTTLGRSTFQR